MKKIFDLVSKNTIKKKVMKNSLITRKIEIKQKNDAKKVIFRPRLLNTKKMAENQMKLLNTIRFIQVKPVMKADDTRWNTVNLILKIV